MPRVLPFVTILVLLFLLLSSAATDPHPATVPASPEWSSAACPLDIPDDLLHDIATACSPVDSGSDSHSHSATLSRCCPSLAASLHAAHAAAALAVLSPASNNGSAVPDPPDDSEGCASAAEVALRARGVLLPRPNETCDLTYCYCGVRLRRLHCPGPFVASAAGGRWVPANEDTATLIQTECRLPELDGCTRCLHSLYQLRSEEAEGVTSDVTAMDRQRECQLMGLTWLLDENRAHYLHVAALVFRAFMASPTGVDPTSCSVPGGTGDDIPLLVDSGWVGAGSSSTFHGVETLIGKWTCYAYFSFH
ncbi:uncharacterized GPI-anchored protein At4g28100-like [Musa acuminata AAA Group]|uniref:uncharacterized GPI-anchored protein At4g28100-like n=1 Tax=Musa acuminata AAA Group TaxID=214697 RepID=UPI0031D306E9